jgi:hypothetical protein
LLHKLHQHKMTQGQKQSLLLPLLLLAQHSKLVLGCC